MLKREDVHIIAEAGTNNNGKLAKAKKLAEIAKTAKVDSIKFQIINTWGLYLPGNYEYGHYDIKEVLKIRQEGQMSDAEYGTLASYCKEIGIEFSASVFDIQSLDLLMKFNPPYVKLASCDLNHIRFIREVVKRDIKMVISTGMSTFEDVEKTVNELSRLNFTDFVLMHCVSVYPASLNQANLGYIKVLKDEFNVEVGFSDHTRDSIAACMALEFGATWFEKHFTEDRKQLGLDHANALEPDQLKQYVADIGMAIEAIKVKKKELSESELYTRKRARRSLYSSRKLSKGHLITNDDVLIVRPEGEMRADEIDFLIGKKLKFDLEKHQGFNKAMLQE